MACRRAIFPSLPRLSHAWIEHELSMNKALECYCVCPVASHRFPPAEALCALCREWQTRMLVPSCREPIKMILSQHAMLLEGFNFNRHGSLHKILRAEYTASVDRATNSFTVSIPSFDPSKSLSAPSGATHVRLTACGVRVDFGAGTYESTISRNADIPLDDSTTGPIILSGIIPGDGSHPVFLALSAEFLQQVNGEINALHNHDYNAMAIEEPLPPAPVVATKRIDLWEKRGDGP